MLLVVDAHGDDEIVQLPVRKFLNQMQCIAKVSAREAFQLEVKRDVWFRKIPAVGVRENQGACVRS